MKVRDSGMPEVAHWESFFDPVDLLATLACTSERSHVVEFGCGYGTFTLAAAGITQGSITAFDIDQAMVKATEHRLAEQCLPEQGYRHVNVEQRDLMEVGTGLKDACADYVMIFNLLHGVFPEQLLGEAYRILSPGGYLAIIHWAHKETPRGPDLAIRPRPEQCVEWAEATGFKWLEKQVHDLPPWHYGLVLRRP